MVSCMVVSECAGWLYEETSHFVQLDEEEDPWMLIFGFGIAKMASASAALLAVLTI